MRIDGASNVADIEAHGGGFVIDPIYSVRSRRGNSGARAAPTATSYTSTCGSATWGSLDDGRLPSPPEGIGTGRGSRRGYRIRSRRERDLDVESVDEIVRHFEQNLGPLNGAKVVARAWTDPVYNAPVGGRDGGDQRVGIRGPGRRPHGRRREHAGGPQPRRVHAVLLLSVAHAWPATQVVQGAGLPLAAVREPRRLLAEMGTELADNVEIRVWDSSADARYLVLPMRPDGTADLSEEELAAARDPGLDDRRGAAVTDAQPRVASLSPASGRYPQPAEAPLHDESLPRDNGDFVFDAPWEARALAIA